MCSRSLVLSCAALSVAAGVLASGGCFAGEPAQPAISSRDLPRVPATEPADAISTFVIRPGFELQLAAAEPEVMDPVAMDFDEDGRLFVVEMRDYSERRDQRMGRIRVLEDRKGDGHFGQGRVLAADLPWPTAVLCYDGGVFVASTPDLLYLKDTDGDGVAEVRRTIFTGFAIDSLGKLNVQALINSLRWGIDNRVHGSASLSGGRITCPTQPGRAAVDLRGRDFSFDPRTLDLRPETGGGQHGMSFDDTGRKFLCSNSDHIQLVVLDDRYAAQSRGVDLPPVRRSIAVDGPAAPVFRISPDEPWRVIRTRWRVTGAVPGIVEGGGRPSGYFTGATGVTIYRGNAFPPEFLGDAFIADCGSNLVHRKKLRRDGIGFVAERARDEAQSEFLASRDNWFRPVQFANAPDGTLFVADMYRETIEHPWSIPENLKRLLDLNSGFDRGRIYRIAPKGFRPPAPPRLGSASTAALVALLSHANGWHRDTASRLLFQRNDPAAVAGIVGVARSSGLEAGRLHALNLLASLRTLSAEVLAGALADSSARVRELAVRLTEGLGSGGNVFEAVRNPMMRLAGDPDLGVRHQLAWTATLCDKAFSLELVHALMEGGGFDPVLVAPILAAAGDAVTPLLRSALSQGGGRGAMADWIEPLSWRVGQIGSAAEIREVVELLASQPVAPRSITFLNGLSGGCRRGGRSLATLDATGLLTPLWKRVLETASDPSSGGVLQDRLLAVHLLGQVPDSLAAEREAAVVDNLISTRPEPVQSAALAALGGITSSGVTEALLARWSDIAPLRRTEILALWVRKADRIPSILDAVESARISRSELSAETVQRLRGISDPRLRPRVEMLLGKVSSSSRQEVVNRFLPALAVQGDRSRGGVLYEQRCASCHRIQGRGHAVGPDLESVRSMGAEKLMTQILDPNREVAPSFLSYSVETFAGDALSGILVSETPSAIRLRMAGGLETSVDRAAVKSFLPSGLSLMPEGLEEGLTIADLAGLLEFIQHGP